MQWAASMARIGLGGDASPAQADIFLGEISKLFQELQRAREFQARIKGIDRDAAQFAANVGDLVNRVSPELAEEAPAVAAENLYARLRAAREDFQKHQSLTEQIETETRKLAAAEKDHSAAQLELEMLCRDARCSSAEELPAAEERSARRQQLEANLARCEGQIREHSAGAAVEAFAEEVARFNPDGMNLLIEELGKDLTEIQQRSDQINQTIGAERNELAKMDGSSKAAEASETAGFALAQLQEDVPRYVALRLAAKVLQQGIERYRERNQGPVLARASEIFASLTMDSFEGLRIESDDDGENVIVGVRPGGRQTLGVKAMSTGSCDQLYLAIRIAYLEHWLTSHEPVPFIVDDILLHFDDNRAIAALKVLGELSRRTQVVFFTHHAHILELARHCLPGDLFFPQFLISGTAV